ncbi:uncharacterized protein LOC110106176 [Dendrobium catenatum]|uniref:uncharacterized protein LOC110106176 n=1 Tax=Dendrobium catenatum TaxID=906689 RepID=UPI0009F2E6E4|nr:uncharacterized protein LOC110106176 [Dendrobium catenatum]
MEKKLPNGVWIDGLAGRLFQRVEYEKINLLCYSCGRAGHEVNECLENVAQCIKDQMLRKPVTETGEVKQVVAEAKSSVINSEYGPWIHVQFKNRHFTKGVTAVKARNGINGVRTDNRGNMNQVNIMQKQALSEKGNVDVVEKFVSAPESSSDKDKVYEGIRPGISLSNKYDALLEDNEEDSLEKHGKYDKTKELAMEIDDTGAVNNGTSCLSGSTKVKVAKELKSLGALDPDYMKKKRDERGDRKKEAALYLKEVVRDQDVFFIGLMETKMTSIDKKDVDGLIGKDWSGDLLIPNLRLWKVVTVYGSRCCKERENLWIQLGSCMENSTPSIIGGDFNCVLNKEEKRGGKRFLFSKGPRDMKCFMTNFDFHYVGNIGPRFTWCNNKEGASQIWERLDRCILNSATLQKIPIVVTRHLARVDSDHSPIAFKIDEKVCIKSKTIKFEDTWRSYPVAKSIVYHSWKKKDFGDEGMILLRKISRTLKELFFWSKNKCKDLNKLKEELKKEILDLQNKEAVGIDVSVDDLLLLRSKIHELNVTLRRLSTWWNQRAKARWHEEGDVNSKLFHNFAMARRNGNR